MTSVSGRITPVQAYRVAIAGQAGLDTPVAYGPFLVTFLVTFLAGPAAAYGLSVVDMARVTCICRDGGGTHPRRDR